MCKVELSEITYMLGSLTIILYSSFVGRWVKPLLSAGPAVTSPAAEHHRPLAGTQLCGLMTDALVCKHMHSAVRWSGFEPATCWSQVRLPKHSATEPHSGRGPGSALLRYACFEYGTTFIRFTIFYPVSQANEHVILMSAWYLVHSFLML